MSAAVPRWRISLRTKLALLSLPLLALPWVGYRYLSESEAFLLDGQQQALMGTARAVATVLHDRPQLFAVGQWPPASRVEAGSSLLPGEEIVETGRAPVVDPAAEGRGLREVEAILRGVQRSTSRISVVGRDLRVLALAGSLDAESDPPEPVWRRLWRFTVARVVPPPGGRMDPDWTPTRGREVHDALFGIPGSALRTTLDGRALVVSAAYPIWDGDRVVGAAVVEERSDSILTLRQHALERLLLLTLGGFGVLAVLLLGFASRLSWRIRRLRDEAERAIDGHGRIAAPLAASGTGDEIGDLSRSFSALLERLARHHAYLENMASRLSHELRTPIAVVRSSLENLHAEPLPVAAQPYMARAETGIARLSRILSRMSEATRLEQALATTESERFDLAALVRECVEGYRSVHPERAFEAELPANPVWLRGAPDLAAQMLDKLVDNAVDFAEPGTPIRVALRSEPAGAALSVINSGPPLPAELEGRLFEAMVSARKSDASPEPHLGLGLYVARMIATFHGGSLHAANLPTGGGVCVSAVLPPA